MSGLPVFVFWDTETTGLSAKEDNIVEISMIRVPIEDSGQAHFQQLTLRLRPELKQSFPRATAVHGLSMDQLGHCATFKVQGLD